jgi:hypothetical protein
MHGKYNHAYTFPNIHTQRQQTCTYTCSVHICMYMCHAHIHVLIYIRTRATISVRLIPAMWVQITRNVGMITLSLTPCNVNETGHVPEKSWNELKRAKTNRLDSECIFGAHALFMYTMYVYVHVCKDVCWMCHIYVYVFAYVYSCACAYVHV